MTSSNTDYVFRLKDIVTGAQFLFVAFGALVLVPILTGLDPNVALLTAGIGTLLFQWVTKGNIPPIFLASSFAFIAPIQVGVAQWGIASTLSGLMAAGVFYVILSVLIRIFGKQFIHKLLPAVVVGPVIMSIGLILSPVAVNMALGKTGDGAQQLVAQSIALPLAGLTLAVVLLVTLLARGWLKLIPILVGIGVGYVAAIVIGLVEFTAVSEAAWFSLPQFTTPKWHWGAILLIVPVALAPAVEHIGDMLAISNVTKKDYLQKPGLHKTLLGDGLATMAASALGGPPNTTYSEVTGAVTMTKAFNPAIMTWAAIVAISLAFCGKLGALLTTIPIPVMGGVMLLLFGMIAAIGIKTMVMQQVDLDCTRNLAIVAIVLVFSIGGMVFNFGEISFGGIALGAVFGIMLNLVLPKPRQ
ncbi:uracil-xanthine permease family protein [Ostreibacterium oceani]|uniref:Uracil permease n=1 Tax=Ostreibacterium oceani TaxID=2654998 RepID=A0A6N7EWA3_9GAMM|nr:uracil-xanthine permease family protein [Ostreibacterium oceani]MPV86183.1 uracil permease [Ostreibacterium oceani]